MENSNLNKVMVDGQIKPINGMNDTLVSIFYKLDRSIFMPEKVKDKSYVEKNIAIKNNRTILKPEIVARIALGIDLKMNENVLILGASTGYLSAVLSYQAETVIVVEEVQELLDHSENSVKKNDINNVVFIKNEIAKGCNDQSPFNAIVIEGAVNTVPENILNQLDENGRMLAIISREGICSAELYRRKGSNFNREHLFNCTLPVLDIFMDKQIFNF